MPLHIIHQHTDPVITFLEPVDPPAVRPAECDVRAADRQGSDIRQQRVQGPVPAQDGGGLQDGIEAPPRGAVDEQADQDALVQQAGTRLQPGARQQEQGEEVMVDAQVERGEDDADEQEGDEEGVDGEVFGQAAFEAEVPDLAEGDGEEEDDDDDEGEAGAGLGGEVRGREALDGDEVEGVVV